MLVACITGPDFRSAKNQIKKAEKFCDAVEIRQDLILGDTSKLMTVLPKIDCEKIPTYHDFERTPSDLDDLVKSMPSSKVIKIATMANCVTDSLRMLDLVRRHPHVAGMCMGPLGEITRILAPVYGSHFTFAAVGPPAVKGQLQAEELINCYRYRQLSPSTKVYGLVGNPVAQSPSQVTHNAYFSRHCLDAVYVKMPVKPEELSLFFELVKRLDFSGLSITTPYKECLFSFINCLDEKAKKIGAINTLTFGEEVVGANTDADAALNVLEKRTPVLEKKLVILGSGGSSKAIAYEAKQRGAYVSVCSRRYHNLDKIPQYDILVNTIPVDVNHDPLPMSVVFDINFKREKSPLIERARLKGCRIILGEEMFQAQAALQFSIWGQTPS